jgi:hypothetical protein
MCDRYPTMTSRGRLRRHNILYSFGEHYLHQRTPITAVAIFDKRGDWEALLSVCFLCYFILMFVNGFFCRLQLHKASYRLQGVCKFFLVGGRVRKSPHVCTLCWKRAKA